MKKATIVKMVAFFRNKQKDWIDQYYLIRNYVSITLHICQHTKKFVVKHGKTSVDKNGFCSKMKNELGTTNNKRSG